MASSIPGGCPRTLVRKAGLNYMQKTSTHSFSQSVDQYSPLSEDHRKLSLSSAIQKTKEGLGNMFADDEQSPEELIYNLFKVPNKSDAFIGKLIMVGDH
jgi:hypothetical protein